MAERKLNLDIKKSVLEFEAAAEKLKLNVNKKNPESSKKIGDKSAPDKKFKEKPNPGKGLLLLKRWKKILKIFLIFFALMVIIIIFIIYSYYKTELEKQEEIILENENYIYNSIHATSKLNNSVFYLPNFNGISEENIQNLIIFKDEECSPNIVCKYVGYTQEYDLSTIVDEDFILDKKVINCYDASDCMSNFTYLESSKELFSRQTIKIEKDEKDKLNIYDENNILIAKLEKKDLGHIEELFIWFNF